MASPIIPDPSIEFDPKATEAQQEAVAHFTTVARMAEDELIEEGVELHDSNPELTLFVSRVVSFLGKSTVSSEIIVAWHKVHIAKPETVTAFDDATEDALAADPTHQRRIEKFHSSGSAEREKALSAVRRGRFLTYARRLKLASQIIEDAPVDTQPATSVA